MSAKKKDMNSPWKVDTVTMAAAAVLLVYGAAERIHHSVKEEKIQLKVQKKLQKRGMKK